MKSSLFVLSQNPNPYFYSIVQNDEFFNEFSRYCYTVFGKKCESLLTFRTLFNIILLNDVQGGLGMDKNVKVKNRMIEVTTELIEQHNGNIKGITARMIATKAGVGLGLINYHFGSKEKLITECVQRIIKNV